MNIDVVFQENECSFDANFGQVQTASDGGYERGYEAGYEEGLAARTYEIWTVTYVDGTVEEIEVPQL